MKEAMKETSDLEAELLISEDEEEKEELPEEQAELCFLAVAAILVSINGDRQKRENNASKLSATTMVQQPRRDLVSIVSLVEGLQAVIFQRP